MAGPFEKVVNTVTTWIDGSDPNKEARARERKQQEEFNTQTSLTNQYNRNIWLTDIYNYEKQTKYAFDTAVTNWEYGKTIQDARHAQLLAVYNKSKGIYDAQLGYNNQALSLAANDQQAKIQDIALGQAFQREAMYSDLKNQIRSEGFKVSNTIKSEGFNTLTEMKSAGFNVLSAMKSSGFNVLTEMKSAGIGKLEQGAKLYGIKSGRRIGTETVQQTLNEITSQNTFAKEAKFVESLQKGGQAALGQAGVSRSKNLQSTAAASFRELVALDSSLSGSRNKAAVELLKLQVDASIAETQVDLNLKRLQLGVDTARERARLTIGEAKGQADLRINAALGRQALNINQAQGQAELIMDAATEEAKFNHRILTANMDSAFSEMERSLQQLQLQKQGADLKAEANLNIFPEKLPYAPEPQMPPERKFAEPPEYVAPTVPKGPRVATGFDSVVGFSSDLLNLATQAAGVYGAAKNIFGGAPNLPSNNTPFLTDFDSGLNNNFGDFDYGSYFDGRVSSGSDTLDFFPPNGF